MKIAVKIRKTFENHGTLKAVASVTFDNAYAVHNVKVIENDKGRIMVMPRKVIKDADGNEVRRDIFHPINAEARKKMETAVFKAYDKAIAEAETVSEVSTESAEATENN